MQPAKSKRSHPRQTSAMLRTRRRIQAPLIISIGSPPAFGRTTQSVHIRPTESNSGDGQHVSENGQGMTSPDTPAIALNHSDSQLLMTILDRLAQDPGIPWSQARQAVLRGFWDTLSTR
jgi:hypothetical protein